MSDPQHLPAAPELPYKPPRPRAYRPRIGLIGCGGITKHHLGAYRNAGYDVVALADVDWHRAAQRKDEFYPHASVHGDAVEILRNPHVDVVDIATHPAERSSLIRAALEAGKHVLSQKPFVLDLDEGEQLVALADKVGRKLAVNQNARWAPHVAYIRTAIAHGVIGKVSSVDFDVAWDHNWVEHTPFNGVHHLVLYDYAIHFWDMLHCYTPGMAARHVKAGVVRTDTQRAAPPLLGQAIVEFDGGQASLAFRADSRGYNSDRVTVIGSEGVLVSQGPDGNTQHVTLHKNGQQFATRLEGRWFDDGFDGTMSELLCAIEDDREPANSGRDNLHALALCFAALASADSGQSHQVGEVRRVP